ncbi:hypothetical protein FO519_002623 [Halicephalobus sp. NKZ332]|nr:hypothetical protein FO519_002623 [Halicephalobus sp. NKZ332]
MAFQVVRELMGQNPEYMYMNKWDDFETSLSPSCVGNRLTRRKSLLILVKSSPDRLQNRDAIRATWGKKIQQENWRIRTVFVMGEMREHDVDVYGDILQAEQKQFGDLLVGEFKDHYRNNTLKFMHSIKYARNYCKSGTVPYVLLLDDDYLLSLKNLCTELDKHPPNEHLYMGWRFDTSPFRLIFQKHRVSLNMYPYNRFPPYISAGAVLLTSQTVDEFYLAIQYSKIFPFDDIYTGILAYQLEISTNSLTSDFPVDSQAQESGSTPTFLNISTREVTTTNSNPSSSSGTSPSEFTPSTTERVINCTNETSGLCGFCTKDSTKRKCFVSITPLLFDLSDVDHKIEVELELTKVIQEIGVAHCSLITEDGNTIDVATEVEGEDISLEFSQTFDTETSIFLTCSINGEIFLVNQTILIASFENLVKHQTPFISGFDKSTVSHKSVLVTFIEALPSQFASDSDSGAACILDGKTGKRYPAKWETPSIISCELDSTIPVGTINVYTIRRRELEDATFEFQTPFSISITGGSSTSTSSTITPSVMSASFTSDLNGIIVELGNSASDVVDQVFDCLKIFLGANSFGTNSICKISNKTIEITFGQSPTITPKDPLLVRSGLISSDLSSSSTLSSGVQYDVIMMTVPSDAVSPEVDLVDPGQVISCQASVTLNSEVKSGNGNRNLSYSWGLQDGGTPELGDILQRANSSSVVLDIVNIGSGATIFVNSCNFVEKCSDSLPLSITVGNEDKKFSVQISGIPSSPLPAVKIVMEADPSLMNCNKTIDLSMKNITYDWSINGNTVTHDAVYTIPARVNLPNSVLTVGLTAKYWNPDIGSFMEADTSKSIQYGVEPLVLVLDGEERTVSAENTVIMDASLSYDPNSGSQNLNHSWNCSKASGANCSELKVDFSRPKLVIPGGTLKAKEIYFFTDTISNNLGATILGKVSIDVVEAKIPSIQILPILETSISTESYLRIQALVQSQTGDLETEWQLLKSATNQPQTSGNSQVLNVEKESVVNISSLPKSKQNFNDLSPGSLFVISFTIPPKNSSKFGDWTGLDPGNYSARLIASNSDGEAFTDVEFEVLPPLSKPRIYATPLQGLSALQTTIELSTDESEISNNPILLKFGLRTILVGNRTDETWFRESAVKTYRTILAAAWPEPYAPCDRVAYEGLLQVCDLAGSCTQTATDRFVVQHPMNESEALKGVLEDITADISSGDIDSALQKLRAVQQEQCNNTIDSSIADSLIDKVLNNLENSTDPEELLAGINVCAAVISSASSSYVLKVVDLLTWTQSRLQGLSTQPEARIKRSIPDPSVEIENTIDSESPEVRVTRSVVESQVLKNTMDSSSSVKMEDSTISSLQRTRTRRSAADSLAAMANVMTAASPETNADVMLSAFDLTVQSNLDIAEPYINNIITHISTFCQSVDSTRTMTAQGKAYTSIQAEGLVPSEKDFLNSSFTIALNLQNSITFDSNFQQYFSNYKCGQNMELTCIEVCLGSAMIDRQILFDNTYIKYYFFPTEFNAATFNNLVSNFHLLLFEDTQIESTLNLQGGAKYTVLIPLSSYIVSNYYQCFVYSKGFWDNTVCTSQEYATKVGNNMYSLGCSCILSGIVAVFTVTPPTPPYYPPLNEVLLTFNLSTTTACSAAQMSQFLLSISSATTVSTNRFQNITCSPGSDESLDPATLVCYLRPPFKEGQTDNSHTIQSITRAVGVTGGLQAYGKIFVTGFTADVVERTLQGDGNARKIPLRINKSFRDVVGNDSDSLEQKWSKAIATTMGVDQYRIKNPIISDGIIFNFTITLPFENEKSPSPTPLSAEELSLLVMEQTIYNEIDLRDNTNQPMPIDPLAYDEIVKLVVQTPTNSLMTILAIVVSTVILLSSFCVGGLVILKIRTDRLIEAHNRNIRTVDIDPNDPLGVVPFESNGVIIRPTAFSKHMDKAADTVVFGQNPITTRHR